MTAPINKMIDDAVKPIAKPNNIKEGEFYATHEGILNIGGIEFKVFILNNGQRIIDSESLKPFIDLLKNA